MSAAAGTAPRNDMTLRLARRGREVMRSGAVVLAFVIVCVAFAIFAPNFATAQNWENIARQTAMLSIVTFGVTIALIAGQIDISVGAIMALSGMVVALLAEHGAPMWLAVLAGLGVGLAAGTLNALLVVRGKLLSLLVTLATLSVFSGLALALTSGRPVMIAPSGFTTAFATGSLLGLPAPLFFTLGVLVAGTVLLKKTVFGRHVYATGGGQEAAKFAGVRTDRVTGLIFVISGLLSALAGIMLAARLFSALPTSGTGTEIDAIAAGVLGGASIDGGRGALIGALFGAVLIGVVSNGLTLLGVNASWQLVVKGGIIVFAILIDRWVR
jgi:ribose transport system permease protein